MKSGNVLLGVLAGVAAGALLGILMAPEKGSKTRQQIAGLGDELAGTLKEKLDEVINSLKGNLENDRNAAVKIADRVKSIVDVSNKEILNGTK